MLKYRRHNYVYKMWPAWWPDKTIFSIILVWLKFYSIVEISYDEKIRFINKFRFGNITQIQKITKKNILHKFKKSHYTQ